MKKKKHLLPKPAAPTQIDEHEHDDPRVLVESHVVITTDAYPIDSRARGVGWVAWFGLPLKWNGPASVGSANKHGDVPGRSRPCLDHRDRPLALVQPGIHAASSEAGARRHRRYSHASTESFSAAKGPAFLQNFQLRGASIFRYPLVPSIWRSSISPQVHVMSHHWAPYVASTFVQPRGRSAPRWSRYLGWKQLVSSGVRETQRWDEGSGFSIIRGA